MSWGANVLPCGDVAKLEEAQLRQLSARPSHGTEAHSEDRGSKSFKSTIISVIFTVAHAWMSHIRSGSMGSCVARERGADMRNLLDVQAPVERSSLPRYEHNVAELVKPKSKTSLSACLGHKDPSLPDCPYARDPSLLNSGKGIQPQTFLKATLCRAKKDLPER